MSAGNECRKQNRANSALADNVLAADYFDDAKKRDGPRVSVLQPRCLLRTPSPIPAISLLWGRLQLWLLAVQGRADRVYPLLIRLEGACLGNPQILQLILDPRPQRLW